MASEWRYRGRVVTADDITSIRQLIAENPASSVSCHSRAMRLRSSSTTPSCPLARASLQLDQPVSTMTVARGLKAMIQAAATDNTVSDTVLGIMRHDQAK